MITKRARLEDVNTAFADMQQGRVIRTVLHT
jgi:Zn-dependent alcohol dehydrogenase